MSMSIEQVLSFSSLTKEAIGQRQTARIMGALQRQNYRKATKGVKKLKTKVKREGDEAVRGMSPAPEFRLPPDSRPEDIVHLRRQAVGMGRSKPSPVIARGRAKRLAKMTPAQRKNWKARRKRVDEARKVEARKVRDQVNLAQDPRTEARMISGRHSPDDVVDLNFPETVAPIRPRLPGFRPKEVAWRGSDAAADVPTPRSRPKKPKGTFANKRRQQHYQRDLAGFEAGYDPRWFSAFPGVSAGYIKSPREALRAYRLSDVPAANQGPWTRHIARDSRTASPQILRKGTKKSKAKGHIEVGESPFYEKVIDAQAIPEPMSVYKPLPTGMRFQRTRGPNVIRGEAVTEKVAAAVPVRPKDQEFLDEHFSISPAWKQFHKKLKKPQFVSTVRQDSRADNKLKRFARMVGTREQSRAKPVAVVGDSGKKYKIKYHPEAGRFSCSCPDWTYKRSVRNKGAGGECKHIKRLRQATRSSMMDKVANPLLLLRLASAMKREEMTRDASKKLGIQNKAYETYFPKESLLSVFGRSGGFNKLASVRGAAAKALLAKK